jgi:hypothetical protein
MDSLAAFRMVSICYNVVQLIHDQEPARIVETGSICCLYMTSIRFKRKKKLQFSGTAAITTHS